jgi:DUF971 family protein
MTLQSDVPVQVSLDKQTRTLILVWHDTEAVISHRVLRRSCRCSVCESTRRNLNDVMPVAHDIALRDLEVLGSVGLRFFFSYYQISGNITWSYQRPIVKIQG